MTVWIAISHASLSRCLLPSLTLLITYTQKHPHTRSPPLSLSLLALTLSLPLSTTARVVTYAAKDKVKEETAITGMVFDPIGELQPIPPTQDESFARQHFHPACEAALNDQINVRTPLSPPSNPLTSSSRGSVTMSNS